MHTYNMYTYVYIQYDIMYIYIIYIYTYKLMGCMNHVLPLAAQDQIFLKASAAAKVAIESGLGVGLREFR